MKSALIYLACIFSLRDINSPPIEFVQLDTTPRRRRRRRYNRATLNCRTQRSIVNGNLSLINDRALLRAVLSSATRASLCEKLNFLFFSLSLSFCLRYHRSGAVPRTTTTTTKIDEEKTKSLSRTYHTIKDMISSRFGPSRKDVEPEPEASLNNVTEELRKSSRSIIDDDEARKKEGIYGKPRSAQDTTSVNVQQYSKNAYGKSN